jgi:hypothetical protein
LALGILSGAISIDKIFDFFNFGGKKWPYHIQKVIMKNYTNYLFG